MAEQLIKVLTSLGLSDKEAKVFLSCTENGTTVVSNIAQSAGINRVTTYDILEKLKQKGLVSFYTKKKIKYFTAIDPEILLQEYEERTNNLRRALPKFKAIKGEITHPRIRYFEGLEGIKTIYAESLNSKTDILNYCNSTEIRKVWTSYDQDYVEKRAKKKIFLRGLAPKDQAGEKVHQSDAKYHRETRLIPSEKFNFTNEINIYDDKVAIISFKDELIGMVIESQEIANSQRAIFEMCWSCSELADIKETLLKPIKESEISKTKKPEDKAESKSNLSLF